MKPVRQHEQGFTLVEVLIAIVVLAAGLLGLVGSAALVTRMIARGQRSGVQAAFSARRLEMLRSTGCASQAAGSETLLRGSTVADSLSWRFVNRGNNVWQIVLRSKYRAEMGRWRTDSAETEITCLI